MKAEEKLKETIDQEILEAAEKAVAGENNSEDAPEGALSPEDEIKDLTDKYLRSLAEMQNLRARVTKDLDDTRKYAVTSFATDLIEVLENLYRSKTNIDELPEITDAVKPVIEGVQMTLTLLEAALKKHGIERVAPEPGADFDYNIHQAVVQVPSEEIAEGKIYNLVQAGYTIKDRVLKPAVVAVAKKP